MAIYLVVKFCIPIKFIFSLREYVGWIKAICGVQTSIFFPLSIKNSFIGIALHWGSGHLTWV